MDHLLAALNARIRRFAESGDPSSVLDPAALDEAARLWEAAQPADGDTQAVSVDVIAVLAYLHLARHEAPHHEQDQDELPTALSLFGVLADRAPERVPDHVWSLLADTWSEPSDDAERLTATGSAAFADYQRTWRPEVLDEAVTAFRDAVAVAPAGHRNLASYLSNMGTALRARFGLTGNAADLDAAIDAARQAVATALPDDPDLAAYLSNLASTLLAQFNRAGDSADLDAAIDAARQAVAVTPPGHPDLAAMLLNLASPLLARFELAEDSADLDAAIDAVRQGAAITPPGHPDLGSYYSDLGKSLHLRFELTGDAADLDAAIDAARQAVAVTPPGHPGLPGYLSNLGTSLRRRFERTGDDADLDAAIDAARQAIAVTSPGHPGLATALSILGACLHTRFERTGDGADLDAAIDAGRQAVAITPPGHPGLATMLSSLTNALFHRFERAGNAADLDAAINAARQAVAITPPGHPALAGYLTNLGNPLRSRFERTGDAADLDAAIDAAGQAVTVAPPGHPDLAGYLSNLGISLLARFGRARHGADLDAAIEAARQAVAVTPPGHPNLAGYLSNLGTALLARFERTGNNADRDAVIGYWQQASQVPTGTPGLRLAAARSWADAAAYAGRIHEAADGYQVAVGLLPAVAWHGLGRATREEQLAQWAGLTADAAGCAILDSRPELAVELLEQGRSVLWTQALNLRSDLTRLAGTAPELADRLDAVRAVLDSPLPAATPTLSQPAGDSAPPADRARDQHHAVDVRRHAAREWDDILAQVRTIAGFEHFLAAIPYPELAAVAVNGPVVIVNVSRYGGHALIVAADTEHVRVVNLPSLSLDAAADCTNGMLQALAGAADPRRTFQDREKDRRAILTVLDWLWDVIAEPVLTALGRTSTPESDSPWPRVWWCATGPLTLLPLHAAGHHPQLRTAASNSIDCVLDRVISSYTPTLNALARARQPAAPALVRQLTVGMPTTPGLPPLPAVRGELKVLARYFPPGEANHQLVESRATRAAALTAIADHSWVHLACHAGQEQADPDRSGFALWDATLTIADLAGQPTQGRSLAFLSACQTATGSVRQLDEAIHLAAAMQFLGYRHVIATMWTIADSPAPFIADAVYTTLTHSGKPDPGRTAEALDQALRSLRQLDPTNPLLWAPYIHLGI